MISRLAMNDVAKWSDRKRLFVVGCPRSGTTLVQRLLAERASLYTLPETHFFANLVGNRESKAFPSTARTRPLLRQWTSKLREKARISTKDAWLSVADFVEDLDIDAREYGFGRNRTVFHTSAHKFVSLLDALAENSRVSGWIEKTPDHIHYVDYIVAYVPDVKVIHVIRQPKDNIASIWDAAKLYERPWARVYDRIERAVDRWNKSIVDAVSYVGHSDHVFVPYEVVASQPSASIQVLLCRLGLDNLDVAENCCEGRGDHRAFVLRGERWKQNAVSGPIAPARSKWESALSEEDKSKALNMMFEIPSEINLQLHKFAEDLGS